MQARTRLQNTRSSARALVWGSGDEIPTVFISLYDILKSKKRTRLVAFLKGVKGTNPCWVWGKSPKIYLKSNRVRLIGGNGDYSSEVYFKSKRIRACKIRGQARVRLSGVVGLKAPRSLSFDFLIF